MAAAYSSCGRTKVVYAASLIHAKRDRVQLPSQIQTAPDVRRSITVSPQPSEQQARERRSVTFTVHTVEQPAQQRFTGPDYSSGESVDEQYTEQNFRDSRNANEYTDIMDGYESDSRTVDSVFTRSESYDTIEDLNMYQEHRRVVSDGEVQRVLKERAKVEREIEMGDQQYRRSDTDTYLYSYVGPPPDSQTVVEERQEDRNSLRSDADYCVQEPRRVEQDKKVRDSTGVKTNRIDDRGTGVADTSRRRKQSCEMFEKIDREIRILEDKLTELRRNSERAKQELQIGEQNVKASIQKDTMYQPNTSYESETQIKHNQRKYNERESTPRDTGERGNTPRYCYRQDGDRNESATQKQKRGFK